MVGKGADSRTEVTFGGQGGQIGGTRVDGLGGTRGWGVFRGLFLPKFWPIPSLLSA